MPPVKKSVIDTAERQLTQPLVSDHKRELDVVDFDDTDVRLGILALSSSVELQSLAYDRSFQRRMHLLYNLENYIDNYEDGLNASMLRKGQQDVFHDIYDFVRTRQDTDQTADTLRGYIKLPTGVGKTAIFSTLVDVLNKPLPNGDRRLKSLVLVPKLDLVEQTVGINGMRGFAQFGQDTTTSRYTAYEKDLTGDAVVMTYPSLVRAYKAGRLNKDMFDIIICDEAHRALGEETAKAFESIAGNSLVIGLTATPEYKTRHVSDLLPKEIHSLELREAIETGLLASVQCFAVTSDAKIKTIKSGEFNDAELEGLINDEWRNQQAVQFVKQFVEQGKQGIVSCVPGQDKKHANDMAALIEKELILDSKSGELRRIRALAITGETTERTDLYQQFEKRQYDVFTYVDVLTEGWDSEAASFLVNLRPTTSPVNAAQRLGRVLRRKKSHKVATIIEFIDDTSKPLHTFFHVIGETVITQGKLFGKTADSTQSSNSQNELDSAESDDPLEIRSLSEDIRRKLSEIDHVELASLLVGNLDVAEAPNGSVSVVSFAKSHGFSTAKFGDRLNKVGIEPFVAKLFGKAALCMTVEMQDEAVERIVNLRVEKATDDIKSIAAISRKIGMAQDIMLRLLEEADIPTVKARFGPKTALGLTEDSQRLFFDLPYFKIEEAKPGEESSTSLSNKIGISEATISKYIERATIPLVRRRIRGRIHDFILAEDVEIIEVEMMKRLARPSKEIISVVSLGEELGLTPPTIHKVVQRLGISTATYKFGKAGVGAGVTEEDKQVIIKAVEYSRDETHISVHDFAMELHVTRPTLLKMLSEMDLEPLKLLVGTGFVIPRDMREKIKSAIADGTISKRFK